MDFMALEPLLVARLRAEVPDLKDVFTAREADAALSRRELSPVAHVVYGGFQIAEVLHGGLAARLAQTWLIVISATSAKGQRTGAGPREIAGPVMARVMEVLLGWKPSRDFGRLLLSASPQARHVDGFSYFPMTFSAQVIVHGADPE
jgi:hypothetical protein